MNRALPWLAGLTLLLAGCARIEPLDREVEARNDLEYNVWQKRHLFELTAEDRELYQRAIQETRYFIMREIPGLSPAEQQLRLLTQIDTLKVRIVIAEGFRFANDRLQPMLDHDREVFTLNQHKPSGPGTLEHREAYRASLEEVRRRIEKREAEIRANEEIIRRFAPDSTDLKPRLRPMRDA